jgi:hypothetical protein
VGSRPAIEELAVSRVLLFPDTMKGPIPYSGVRGGGKCPEEEHST